MAPAFAVATITTTTTLTTPASSVAVGTAMNLTVTVTATSGSGPTGTVTFKSGTATLGTATLSGTGLTRTATYAATFTTVATNSLTAVYAGDTASKTSTSAAKSVSSTKATPTNTLSSSLNPSTSGASVTFTATVTGYSPTGTVTFKDGTTTLGTGTLAGTGNTRTATYTTSALSVASHSITAMYAGNTLNNTATSAALSQVVNPALATTTTTLTTPASSVAVGTAMNLTATVTAASGSGPTGTVTFKNGTATLGTATLSGTGLTRTATYAATFTTVATNSLTAVYAGDTASKTSTSAAKSVSSTKATPTNTLSSSLNPSTSGASVTFTATVTGYNPTGTVTFKDGTTTLGTGTLAGTGNTRTATYTTAALSVASHSVTAVYAGNTLNNTVTSAALSQVVSATAVATTTTVASSLNPSTFGTSITFTASVTGTAPTGTVTFKDGATTLGTGTLSGTGNTRTATYTTTTMSVASHSITAVYAGGTGNLASTSAALSQVVNAAAAATTTTVASSLNPSAVGAPLTLTASVTGSAPTGSVTFKDGATTLGTGTLSGTGNTRTATLSSSFATAGSHSLTVVYAGDGANAGSTSVALVQTVKVAPTVTLTSSVNPTNVGQSTVLVAKATGSNLRGVLKIMDGATVLATWNVTGGVAGFTGQLTTPFATGGTHSLTATYSGDAVNADSTSAVVAQLVKSTVPVVTLTSSINPAYVYTQRPALQAKVTGTNLNGVLKILDGSTEIASWNVSGGYSGFTGTVTTNFSVPGNHSLTATYSGDVANANSASPVLNQVINLAPTTTALASDTNPVNAGTWFTLTASVTGSNYPGGTVTFRDGAVVLGTGDVYSGTATLSTRITNVGAHNITATYDGDGFNAPSASPALSVVVNKAIATINFFTSPPPFFFGTPLNLRASVEGSSPSGSITFKDGTTAIGTVALSNGWAILDTATLSMGSHNLTAVYAGDANNTGVTSSVLTQTVEAANIAPTVSITTPRNGARALAPASTYIAVTAADSDGAVADVSLLVGGSLAAISRSPPYEFNLNGWPVGTYDLVALATDNRGMSTASSVVTLNVVATNVPPVVSLTSPANGANFETPVTINLTANATDSDGPISQVAFYDGATLLGTSTAAPYSFGWVNAPAGTHNLTAVAIDDVGAITTSSVVAITIKANLPPTVSLTSPATGTNYATAPGNITLSATAADSDGTVTKVEFYSGSTLLSTSTTAPYTYNWTNIPGGSYAITAVATDNSGNTTTSSVANINVGTVVRVTYLHNDFSGSAIAATDSLGAIVWKENYRPYGDKRNVQAASLSNRQWFHGKPVDEDTGLSYFGARYYDASLGRFMGVDAVTFKESNYHSFNRYAYGNNNPYKYIDPDGMQSIEQRQMMLPDNQGNCCSLRTVSMVPGFIQPMGSAELAANALMAADGAIALKALAQGLTRMAVKEVATEAPAVANVASKAFSKDKQALVEMAKADKKAGMTSADMQAYKDLNKGLKDPFPTNKVRGPEAHSSGAPSSQAPHGHVGPVDHIPIRDSIP